MTSGIDKYTCSELFAGSFVNKLLWIYDYDLHASTLRAHDFHPKKLVEIKHSTW